MREVWYLAGRHLVKMMFVICICFLVVLAFSSPVEAYTFPSGDWWAINAQNHEAWAVEEMPSAGYVWWRSQFHWTENNWPADHWEWVGPPQWYVYVNEWYIHEMRRFEYQQVGDPYDYDVMDATGDYYTTLPPPHDIEREEAYYPQTWPWDNLNNDEEVEVICKEPCDIQTYHTYVVRVTFDKHSWYDDYTIVFESEHGNGISSPPDDFKEIERIDYVVPSAVGLTSMGTRSDFIAPSNEYITNIDQLESPLLDVVYKGGNPPYLTMVIQGNYLYEVHVREYAQLSSFSQVERFIQAKTEDLEVVKEGDEPVDAIVTFNSTISVDSVLELIENHSLGLHWLRYLSSEGGGKLSFPLEEDIVKKIKVFEESLRDEFGSTFQLVKGIGAIRASIPLTSLQSLVDDPRVLVVDSGPISTASELSEAFPDIVVRLYWYDIFQEYMKLCEEKTT
jgi:hypothetical protein